ncbi:MAG TPA: T9SS type A sorting domain-containing protein [bacterium]|nr:T9SS type A sorting domain-containing protein [bacterium]HQJ66565.1 T9SS type A sorting domain-containing protein [bacterium]
MKKAIVIILIFALMLCAGSLFAKGKELAIISAARFDNYVYQYKMWKSLEGFNVTIKKADSLGGLDTTNVYDWIHSTWWPGDNNFVFILGKASEVPGNRLLLNDYPGMTDWFYQSHDHSTSIKKNHANIMVGRMVANSSGADVLKKLLGYEFLPKSYNPKKNFLFAQYKPSGEVDHAQVIRGAYYSFSLFGWTPSDTMMFDVSPFSSWSGASYKDSLETRWANSSIILYQGHGDINGTGTLNGFGFDYDVDDLPLVQIKNYQFFMSGGCANAGYGCDYYGTLQDHWSFLDQMLCQTSSSIEGPIGAFGMEDTAGGVIPWDLYDTDADTFISRSEAAITDSGFTTWGQAFRGMVRLERGESPSTSIPNHQFVGDPTISLRTANPHTAEVAPSSYISVALDSVTAHTGSDVGTIRVSAYAPNTGWDSTTTLSGNTYARFKNTARPLFIAFTKDDASKTPTIWTTGGTLNVNTWMLGKINVNGDLTVASGRTMEVLPGTTMSFKTNADDRSGGTSSSKAELIINGTLKADSATFTRYGSSGYWSGIKFGTTASSSSHILGCTVNYAVAGVYIDQADPTISDNQILDNDDYGVYVTGSSAWPTITNNYIAATDYAVYISAASSGGQFGHDAFRSATYGLFLANGSPVFEGESNGYNFWDSSISNKRVYVYSGYLELGMTEDPGNNSFTKGDDNSRDYIYNASGTTVYARYCYFYDCPNPDTDWFYGSVDRSSKLSYPPSTPPAGPDFAIPKIAVTSMRQYREIKQALAKGEKFSHAKLLNSLVVDNIEYEFAARPLDLLLGNLSKTEGLKVVSNLGKYNKMHDAVRFALDQWQVRYDSQSGIPDEALLKRYQGTAFEKAMALTYAAGLASNGQKEKAVEVLTKANQDTDPLILKSLIDGLDNPETIPAEKALATPAEKQSVEVSAFPNPFNSESRIQFKLAQKGMATVTIYNMLGQKVVSLVSGERSAGTHSVSWNGKNQAGLQVPTGVYFCQIIAGGARQTLKLFMLR